MLFAPQASQMCGEVPGEHILAAIVLAAARGAALVFVILVLAPLNRLAAAPAAEMRAGAMWWC